VAAEAKSDGRSNVREAIAVVLEGEPAKGDGKGKGGRRAGRTRRGKFADLPTLATGKRAAKPDNPSAQGAAEGSGPTAVAEAVALALGGEPEATAADVAEVAAVLEALNHESLNRSPRKNWVERAGQLPAAIQHMAKDIHEERGLPLDQAIPIAISQAKKLAAKGNAKYAAAVAEWEKLKATSRVQQSALTEAILGTLGL
jgi:antitoxin component of RelBE/YafQ-DinJ toxin-antitoxin module